MIETIKIDLNANCHTCFNYGWNGSKIETCKKGIIRVPSLVFPNCHEYFKKVNK